MIKKIAISVVLFVSMYTFAQQGTSSPYSYFGIGETKFKGAPDQKAMGGLGIFPDSIHLNLLNPASYSNLLLTSISVGGGTAFTDMKTEDVTEKSKRSSLEYLAIGIPLGKFGAAFGINPNTVVGYRIRSVSDADNNISQYTGEGGSNRVFLGGAYKINSNFDIGVDANYYFGQISTISRMYVQNVQFGTRIDNVINLSGFSFNLGLIYRKRLNDKYELHASTAFTPSYKLNFQKNTSIGTITQASGFESVDQLEILPTQNQDVSMPSKFSIGGGFGEMRKWAIGTEFAFTGKGDISDPISGSYASFKNENAMRVSLGGYFVPKYNSFTSYLERVTYRGGLRYENTGVEINGEKITDIGASLGFNLPIGNGFSDLSFAFEYGKRGTVNAGLIQENYFNITVGISVVDKWFRKILYD